MFSLTLSKKYGQLCSVAIIVILSVILLQLLSADFMENGHSNGFEYAGFAIIVLNIFAVYVIFDFDLTLFINVAPPIVFILLIFIMLSFQASSDSLTVESKYLSQMKKLNIYRIELFKAVINPKQKDQYVPLITLNNASIVILSGVFIQRNTSKTG